MDFSTNSGFSRSYYIFIVIFLGLLSAFGPFVTDMYLPTLPAMVEIFHTTPSMVQMGLSTSMIGLAAGQIFFGPLSDQYGRRVILFCTLILFCISTVVSIFSPTIEFFNACRFLQGLGGAGCIVLSRSISTDCYSGRALAKMLAIVGAVNGIAPVTAPVVGGLVAESVGWKGIFWILFGIGVVLLLMCMAFQESLPKSRRHVGSVFSLVYTFPKLFKMKYFMVYVLLNGLAMGVLFAYISSASFIIQTHYGFSELIFAVIFGVNAIGIGLGSALSLKFKKLKGAALCGSIVVVCGSILQLIFFAVADYFFVFESIMFVILTALGFIFTSSTTLAMDEGRNYTGGASAIFGAMGFVFGSLVSPLVGLGNIMWSTFIVFVICAAATLIFAIITWKRPSTPVG